VSLARYTCPIEAVVEFLLDHLAHVLERDRRGRVPQRRELVLELLAVLLGHQADIEERHHLSDLHRSALHRPQRRDDLFGGLDVSPLERCLALVLGARHVRRPGARLANRLSGRQPPDLGGSPHARGGDLVFRHAYPTLRRRSPHL
jgi:hypothetical protein